jgi:hypothetical protein
MCGAFGNPNEIARALAVAAADKVVVSQTGKSVEEINIELGRQMALLYKTILGELMMEEGEETSLENHFHSHDQEHEHSHGHIHSHVH